MEKLMGVKLKKRNGAWWVFVNHHGRRKAKKIGSEKAAKEVAAKIQAKSSKELEST
jgi:integrase